MVPGKTIRLYLTDGSPTGPILAEIMNWTGQVMLVPRAQLHELAKREELRRTGVYALVGPDAQASQDRVYIGEGDEVFARLKDHDKDEEKDFWTRAVTVTSKDFNLTTAHARHLESRLIELACAAGRGQVSNCVQPARKTLPEPDVADMEYFLEQIKMVLPLLGFDFLRAPAPSHTDNEPILHISEVGATAKAKEVEGIFVVLQGSTARREGSPSGDSYIVLRDKLVAQGKLAPRDASLFEFTADVEFSSPSAAAAVVAAANRNGRLSWRLPDGQTYAQWKEAQVEEAET